MTRLFVVAVVLFGLCSAAGAEVVVEPAEKSKDPKAKPAYKFEVQKGKFKYDGYRIWGKLTDGDDKPVRGSVTMVFTAYDSKGKFLARANARLGGSSSDGEGLGHVDGLSLETDSAIPARIVWRVISGAEKMKAVKLVKSTDKTSADVGVTFELQRVGKGYSGVRIWGKVRNTTMTTYKRLEVIVTGYDDKGKFIARGRASVGPSNVAPGQVGYVDGISLDTGNSALSKIEWKVIEEKF